MKQYLRLLQYIKPYRWRIVQAIICMIVAAAANLYMPWIIKDMIDKVLAEKDMETLNMICIGVIVIFFVRGFFYFGQSYLISHVGQRVVLDIRNALFAKFQRLPIAYFDRHQTGEIMSYIANDVATVQNAMVEKLIDIVTEGAVFIGSLVMMFMLDWQLSLLTLITVPLVGVSMRVFGRMIKNIYRPVNTVCTSKQGINKYCCYLILQCFFSFRKIAHITNGNMPTVLFNRFIKIFF